VDELTIIARVAIAALLGGLLGLEREWRGHHAGFRTHILVSVGACLFTLVGVYGFLPPPNVAQGVLQMDPARVPSQIIVGIGFLGGGAILKYGGAVRGLTTAANLWLAAALGMAVGVGFYFAAVVCAAVALLALAGLRPVERKFFPRRRKEPLRQGNEEEEHA
jgi:putative Mg2+ transporter-C (MgtC) family protein